MKDKHSKGYWDKGVQNYDTGKLNSKSKAIAKKLHVKHEYAPGHYKHDVPDRIAPINGKYQFKSSK